MGGVRRDPGRPTGLLVKEPSGSRTRVHYYRRNSAASAMGPDVLDDDRLASASVLHLTGVTAALSPSCRSLVATALAAGVLTGLLHGGGMERALRLGHITAASALKVTADHGPLPDSARIERLLALSADEWAAEARQLAVPVRDGAPR